MGDRLGLTQTEVDWLKKTANNKVADSMIRQYQMVVACPNDPGARAIFSAMLDDWRKNRTEAL